jgi:hypothetical protein
VFGYADAGRSAIERNEMKLTASLCAGVICSLTWVIVSGQAVTSPASLPDWSGAWVMEGPTVFDTSTVQPKNGRARRCRRPESPPYNEEWEAIYESTSS